MTTWWWWTAASSSIQSSSAPGSWSSSCVPARSNPPDPYDDPDRAPAAARYLTQVDPEVIADIVVDLHEPGWPVIRRMDPALANRLDPQVSMAETRAFFAPRAASWEQRFPDDAPERFLAIAERTTSSHR